jgi:signal transduction histidine kinase
MKSDYTSALIEGRRPVAIAWAFAIALTAVLWLAINHNLDAERVKAMESGRREAMNFARVFEEHIERTLLSVDSALLFVKHQYDQFGDRTDLSAYVRKGLIVSDRVHQIGVIDATGTYHLSNLVPHRRVDLSDRAHFLVHRERDSGNFFLSKPVLGRATGKWSLQMTRRINKPDGDFGGVVVASIDPYYFTNFYGELHLGSRSSIKLVGADGVIRALREGTHVTIGQNIAGTALHNALLSKQAGYFDKPATRDDGPKLYAFRQLPNAPIYVVVGRSVEEVMMEFSVLESRLLQYGAAMTLMIFLAAVMSSIFIARQRENMTLLAQSRHRAEAADRAKSKFLSVISHELRTPLNGIIGYAAFLHENAPDSTQRAFAKTILTSGKELLSIFNSILSFVSAGDEDQSLNKTLEDPVAIAREVCAQHLDSAVAKGIALVSPGPQAGNRQILCDRPKVVQILSNLVHNAVKFTHVGQVTVSVSYTFDDCIFEVGDSGPGIDVSHHEAIFEYFREPECVETRQADGLGLGLALARELARLIEGKVSLKSSDERGSVFSLSIPLKRT